jgi:hypothetical protein
MSVQSTEDAGLRRERAVAQTAKWAATAEEVGDYAGALAWLEVLDVVLGGLDETLTAMRHRCVGLLVDDAPTGGHVGHEHAQSRSEQPVN